jgi:hypothetical protein
MLSKFVLCIPAQQPIQTYRTKHQPLFHTTVYVPFFFFLSFFLSVFFLYPLLYFIPLFLKVTILHYVFTNAVYNQTSNWLLVG